MGFKIPRGFCLSRVHQKETFVHHFEDKVSFAQERLHQVGLGVEVDAKLLNIKPRAGFSWGGEKRAQSSKVEYSYFYESRPLKMSITNLEKLKINEGFRKDVISSLFPYDITWDKKSKEEFFKGFFSKWGHYVVTSAYVGGSVELKTSSVYSSRQHSNTVSSNFGLELGFKRLSLGAESTVSTATDGNLGSFFSSIKLNWDGGDSQFQLLNLDEASSENWQSWEESLKQRPSVLTTSLQLLSISKIVALIDEEKGAICQKAMNDLIGQKIVKVEPNYYSEQEYYAKTRELAAERARQSSSSCFPGNGMVIRKNSFSPKMISDLVVGDEILCLDPKTKKEFFSEVYMFGHRNKTAKTLFLKFTCDNGTTLTLSPKHLIYVNNTFEVKKADQVEIGDYLMTRNQSDPHKDVQPAKVVKIEEVILDGFYAPFTLCGNMVVDGFFASCYANVNDVTLPLFGKMSAQDVAHLATAPLRAAYLLGSRDFLKIEDDQEMPAKVEWMYKIGRSLEIAS
jgi:hypothetical protein